MKRKREDKAQCLSCLPPPIIFLFPPISSSTIITLQFLWLIHRAKEKNFFRYFGWWHLKLSLIESYKFLIMISQYIWSIIFIVAYYENEKDIQQRPSKVSQILVILNNTSKPTLVQNFQEYINVMHWLSPFCYIGSTFWPLKKNK